MSPCIALTDLELKGLNIVSSSLCSSHDYPFHPSFPTYPTLSFPLLCSPHQAQFVLCNQSFDLTFTYGIWQTYVGVTSLKKNVFFLSHKPSNANRSSVGDGVGFHSHLPSWVLGFFFQLVLAQLFYMQSQSLCICMYNCTLFPKTTISCILSNPQAHTNFLFLFLKLLWALIEGV